MYVSEEGNTYLKPASALLLPICSPSKPTSQAKLSSVQSTSTSPVSSVDIDVCHVEGRTLLRGNGGSTNDTPPSGASSLLMLRDHLLRGVLVAEEYATDIDCECLVEVLG